MEKTDVVIVGGGAAGLVAAQVGRSHYPDKDFLVIRDAESAVIPCAIPYIFGTIGSTEKDILPDAIATKSGARLAVDRVEKIDRSEKVCHTEGGQTIHYEKLILATGSKPKIPGWLKGTDLENVFTVSKGKAYLDDMLERLGKCKKVAVVGGGFIGVELADQLREMRKEVHLVEILPHVLGLAFDEEIAIEAEALLEEKGIILQTGLGVKELRGNGAVDSVLLANGEALSVDAVVLAMGYEPDSTLASEAGIKTSDAGFVLVDEYMRTSDPDVCAIGDCAEKHDFITRRPSAVMLASTACAEARVAASNLYKLCALKTFGGTIAIYSTALDGTGFGTAGITEASARKEGFDIVTGSFTGVDRHPGSMSQAHKQTVRLVVSKGSGVVVGGAVVGGLSAGELTNVLGLVIQNKMSVSALLTTQIGTQPCLTASPAAYPLIKAAEAAAQAL